MSQQLQPQVEEVSLRKVIQTIREYLSFIYRKWYVILIGITLGLLLGYGYYLTTKEKYTAYASFTTESSESSALSSAMALAGQFGFGGGKPGGTTYELLSGIVQSRRVIKNVLLTPATVKGKEDLLVNHYINYFGWAKGWEEIPYLKGFQFTHSDLNNLTPLEDSLLSVFYETIKETNLYVEIANDLDLVTVEFTTKLEDFSKAFCTLILKETEKYFIEKEIRQEKELYETAQRRADSLFTLLKSAEIQLAKWQDANRNLSRAEAYLTQQDLTRKVGVLSAMYTQAMANLESAKFNLLQNTPVMVVVDHPEFSTSIWVLELYIALIAGGLFGLFASTGALILYRMIYTAIQEEEAESVIQNSAST